MKKCIVENVKRIVNMRKNIEYMPVDLISPNAYQPRSILMKIV